MVFGKDTVEHFTGTHYIQHDVNRGVGITKNDALRYLLDKDCEHIFLIEDDRVAMFTALFEKALEEIRLAQEKAEFAKGSLIIRRRTYGKPKKNIYYMK